MIRQYVSTNGRSAFRMSPEDISAAAEWARSLCHLAYGPVEGEVKFRLLPARQVLTLWAQRSAAPVEA